MNTGESEEDEWKRYGEYSLLPSSLFSGIKLRVLKHLNFGDSPYLVNLIATWKCNSKCKMCSIWKMKSKEEISIKRVEEIFSERVFKKTKIVKIMGGEPTLHSEFDELIKTIKECLPKAQVVVSTNGFPFERMKKIIDVSLKIDPEIIFSLSIDGREKVHEKIRGVKGCFKEVMKTAFYLAKLSRKNNRKLLRFSFTITPWNYKELEYAYEIAKKFNTYIGVRLMQISREFYKNDKESFPEFSDNMLEFIENVLKEKAINSFQKDMVRVYKEGRRLPCFAFITNVTIEPNGTLKPCIYSQSTNIKNLSEVWNRKTGRDMRKKIKHCKRCWSDCQTIPDIKASYF